MKRRNRDQTDQRYSQCPADRGDNPDQGSLLDIRVLHIERCILLLYLDQDRLHPAWVPPYSQTQNLRGVDSLIYLLLYSLERFCRDHNLHQTACLGNLHRAVLLRSLDLRIQLDSRDQIGLPDNQT